MASRAQKAMGGVDAGLGIEKFVLKVLGVIRVKLRARDPCIRLAEPMLNVETAGPRPSASFVVVLPHCMTARLEGPEENVQG